MMATVQHVTSGLGLRKLQADGFLLTRVYVSNHTLHFDLHIPYVHTVFRERTATHRTALCSHPNPLMESLVHPPNTRHLKRRWTFDDIH